jgi:hypothetical protein
MDGKPDLIGWLPDDLDRDRARSRWPVPGKAHICECCRDEQEGAARQAQHERRCGSILNVGWLGQQDQSPPVRVHHHLPLATLHL